jgi:hypothetical protein
MANAGFQFDSLSSLSFGAASVSPLPSFTRPYLLVQANKTSIFPSGISYNVGLDASTGAVSVLGTNSVNISSVLAHAASNAFWVVPSGAAAVFDCSFSFAGLPQKHLAMPLDAHVAIQPRGSLGSHFLLLAANAFSLKTPSSTSSVFTNVAAIDTSLSSVLLTGVQNTIASARAQSTLLDAIVLANGPVLFTDASGSPPPFMLLDTHADMAVSFSISGVHLSRSGYGSNSHPLILGPVPIVVSFETRPLIELDAGSLAASLAIGASLDYWPLCGNQTGMATAINQPKLGKDTLGRRHVTFVGNQYVAIPPFALPSTGFTIFILARSAALGNTGTRSPQPLLTLGSNSISFSKTDLTNSVSTSVSFSGTPTSRAGATTALNGNWHVFGVQVENDTMNLFIDSAAYYASVTPGPMLAATTCVTNRLAANADASAVFDGDVRQLLVYDKPLSQFQVADVIALLINKWALHL